MKIATSVLFIILFGISYIKAERIQPDSFLVYEDKSGKLSLDDIQNISDFKQVKTIGFGYSSSAFWIKLPLKAYYGDEPYYAVALHSASYEVDFFLTKNNKLIKSKFTGLARPHQNREVPMDRYYIEITSPDTNQVLYVKLRDVGASVHNNICFQRQYDFFREAYLATAFYYVYAGAALLIILYCLINFFKQRKYLFLYYGLFVLAIALFEGFKSDHLYFLSPHSWIEITQQFRFFLLIPIIVTWLFYSYHLLSVEAIGNSIVNRAYNILLCAFPLYMVLIFFNMPTSPYKFIFINLFYFMVLVAISLTIYSGIIALQNGFRPARYFIFGQFPLIFIYVFYLLRNYAVIPNTESSYTTQLFLGWEMLVMFVCMERYFDSERVIERALETKLPAQTVLENISKKNIESDKQNITPEILELYTKVTAFFETEKIYLNTELKISDVANMLNVPSHQISKCINSCSDMHFFDFVNSYRIEAAKEMINDQEFSRQFTIEYIASKSGFNNKVSFNNAFKKFTGKTPTQYKAAQKTV